MPDQPDAARGASPFIVLVDTNVALDLLMNRAPFVHEALQLFALAEAQRIQLLLSSDAVSTIAYIVEKNSGRAAAREAIAKLLDFVSLAPLTEQTVLRGLSLEFDDIEDSLVAAAAEGADAQAIVTRNVTDFTRSPLPVMTPTEFLAFWVARERA